MNRERGFRRITWGISISLLLSGVGFVALRAWTRLEGWDEAGEPVPHSWVEILDTRLEQQRAFPPLPRRYRSAPTPTWGEGILVHVVGSPPSDEWFWRFTSETFIQSTLEEWLAGGDSPRTLDRDALGKDEIAFLYFPASGGSPSALYSRKAILREEASGHLTRAQQAVLAAVRKDYRFPSPLAPPFVFGELIAFVSLVVCLAAVPWGVFYLIRWIVLGCRAVLLQG